MTPQEITASLAAPYIAVVATISRNGMPRLTPNGYRYDRRVLTLITRTDRLKYLNLQRNNRIPVCIGDPPVASIDVVISGTATCTEHDIWDEARWDQAGGPSPGRQCRCGCRFDERSAP